MKQLQAGQAIEKLSKVHEGVSAIDAALRAQDDEAAAAAIAEARHAIDLIEADIAIPLEAVKCELCQHEEHTGRGCSYSTDEYYCDCGREPAKVAEEE